MTSGGRPSPIRAALLAGLALGSVAVLSGCGRDIDTTPQRPLPSVTSSSVTLTRDNFVNAWPYTVDSVSVRCSSGTELVLSAPDGHEYALNDRARSRGLPPAEPIENGKSDGAVTSFAMKTCAFTR